MADDDGARRLSPKFNEIAKDDPDAALRRRAEALGKPGLEAQQSIAEQRERTYAVRYEREIEQTAARRFDQWVNHQVEKLTSPAPGKRTSPLSPAQYEHIKENGRTWLAADTKERAETLQKEMDEQRREALERTLDRMEQRMSADKSQDRGRDMGRGRGVE
jgi:hypothetical protein